LEKERKRIAREEHRAWIEEQRLHGRWKEEEERWRKIEAAQLKPPRKLVA